MLSDLASEWLVAALRDLGTIVTALIAAGAQWLLLRRYRLDVYWWVPASVAASVIAVLVVIPTVGRLVVPPGGSILPGGAVLAGGAAVGAAGVVIGAAQAFVLRASGGNVAWAWIPVTGIGGGLAGAVTSALSIQLPRLPALATIGLLSAVGALLISASQAPVLRRLLS
jgi:hypothetical protein